MKEYFLPSYAKTWGFIYNAKTQKLDKPLVGLIFVMFCIDFMHHALKAWPVAEFLFLLVGLWLMASLMVVLIQRTCEGDQAIAPLRLILFSTLMLRTLWLGIKLMLIGIVVCLPFILLFYHSEAGKAFLDQIFFFLVVLLTGATGPAFVKASLGQSTTLREGYRLLKGQKEVYFLNFIVLYLPALLLHELGEFIFFPLLSSFSQGLAGVLSLPVTTFLALFYMDYLQASPYKKEKETLNKTPKKS